jgi:hypothetical protein
MKNSIHGNFLKPFSLQIKQRFLEKNIEDFFEIQVQSTWARDDLSGF